jgi:hypothetical protein
VLESSPSIEVEHHTLAAPADQSFESERLAVSITQQDEIIRYLFSLRLGYRLQ